MTENSSLDQRIIQMLTEARVVFPGVQAVLGFQLPLRSWKPVNAASLGLITLAAILLIAPAAYHRIAFAGQDTKRSTVWGAGLSLVRPYRWPLDWQAIFMSCSPRSPPPLSLVSLSHALRSY